MEAQVSETPATETVTETVEAPDVKTENPVVEEVVDTVSEEKVDEVKE